MGGDPADRRRACGHTGIAEDDWGSQGITGIMKTAHKLGDVSCVGERLRQRAGPAWDRGQSRSQGSRQALAGDGDVFLPSSAYRSALTVGTATQVLGGSVAGDGR